MTSAKIDNIVIVGGGTAGWVTALNLLLKTISAKITVIATEEIPVIGVGEGTTALFTELLNQTISDKEFLQETGSTFKLGLIAKDWHNIGHTFTNPIGDEFENETNYPHRSYDYFRIYHLAKNIPYDSGLVSQLMLNDKLPFVNVLENNPYLWSAFEGEAGQIDARFNVRAMHMNAGLVGEFFKRKVLENPRVDFIEGKVVDGVMREDGTLKSVITHDGQLLNGDLFIDCSGFQRILIDNVYKNSWVDYGDQLLVNRAMPFWIENNKNTIIRNYTHSWALKHGWMWQIPLQDRLGCGYIYSDLHTTPEEAQDEIEGVLGHKIIPRNDIKFNSGRVKYIWIKNVISTGLATGFVEPLEATSIHLTILQINHFIEHYYSEYMDFNCQENIDEYNSQIGTYWDRVKDWLVAHYISKRKDTQFWIDASSEDRRSDDLKSLFEIWKTRMPRVNDYNAKSDHGGNFFGLGNSLWYNILMGMNLLDSEVAEKELKGFGLVEHSERAFKLREGFVNWTIDNCSTSNNFYNNILNNLEEYKRSGD